MIRISWQHLFVCDRKMSLFVSVYHCSPVPSSDPNGGRSCTGDANNVYGATCNHHCNSGYSLIGASAVTCNLVSGSGQWSSGFPYCQGWITFLNKLCIKGWAMLFSQINNHTPVNHQSMSFIWGDFMLVIYFHYAVEVTHFLHMNRDNMFV